MKIKLIILSIIILMSTPAIFSQVLNTSGSGEFEMLVSVEDLKNTPSWNPEDKDAPPLSVQDAIQIGRTNLKRSFPNVDDKWSLKKNELNQMGKNKWYYALDFYSSEEEYDDDSEKVTIYIKMDGTIIERNLKPKKKGSQ